MHKSYFDEALYFSGNLPGCVAIGDAITLSDDPMSVSTPLYPLVGHIGTHECIQLLQTEDMKAVFIKVCS